VVDFAIGNVAYSYRSGRIALLDTPSSGKFDALAMCSTTGAWYKHSYE